MTGVFYNCHDLIIHLPFTRHTAELGLLPLGQPIESAAILKYIGVIEVDLVLRIVTSAIQISTFRAMVFGE